MFYRLLLFIFALIMHILFTLCKIGDRGGCLNHLMKIKRRWTFRLRERPIQTRKAKKPQLLKTKLLSAVPFCPASWHKRALLTQQLSTGKVTSARHRGQEDTGDRSRRGGYIGRPGLNRLQSVCGKERHKSLQDQTSVGLFPSCKYITVHNVSLSCRGSGDKKLHI